MWSFMPGQADRRITIQFRGETQDELGEPIETWSELLRPWAKVTTPASGRLAERVVEGQEVAKQLKEFEVRYCAALAALDTKTHRVYYEDRAYDILSVAELGRHVALKITAEARAD